MTLSGERYLAWWDAVLERLDKKPAPRHLRRFVGVAVAMLPCAGLATFLLAPTVRVARHFFDLILRDYVPEPVFFVLVFVIVTSPIFIPLIALPWTSIGKRFGTFAAILLLIGIVAAVALWREVPRFRPSPTLRAQAVSHLGAVPYRS